MIVERGRNENAHYFPFYAAQARACGAKISWLAYGADYSVDPKLGYHIHLPRKDRISLAGQVREYRPTHILSNERLSGAMLRALSRLAPDSRCVFMPDFMRDGRAGDVFPFPWMSSPADGRFTLSSIRPEYTARIMNVSGRTIKGFVNIIGSPHCSARLSFKNKPFLRGVDLTRFVRPVGCTFCVTEKRQQNTIASWLPPAQEALRQLRCFRASRGRRGCRGVDYNITDPHVFLQAGAFFDGLIKMDFPAGAFFFAPRMDDILRGWRTLNRILPLLAAKGHSIHILYTGIENFSPAEQSRFNKGITTAQSVECYFKIKRLKEKYPNQFFLTGFGFILFSPWTTLDDVRRNLSVARRIGYPVCGYMLTSIVRMEPTTPMTLAAQRDGLLVRKPEDPGMDYNAWRTRSWNKDLFHFRFQDPRVRVLFRALVRAVAHLDSASFGSFFKTTDPDFRRAIVFVSRLSGDSRDYLYIAETLVAAAMRLSPAGRTVDLFARAEGLDQDPSWRARSMRAGRSSWLDSSDKALFAGPQLIPR